MRPAGPQLPVQIGQGGDEELEGVIAPVRMTPRLPRIEDEGGDDAVGIPQRPAEAGVVGQPEVPAEDEERLLERPGGGAHAPVPPEPSGRLFGNRGTNIGVRAL